MAINLLRSARSKLFTDVTECLHLNHVSRREKELMKALETPEEKRARRLAKKVRSFGILHLQYFQ